MRKARLASVIVAVAFVASMVGLLTISLARQKASQKLIAAAAPKSPPKDGAPSAGAGSRDGAHTMPEPEATPGSSGEASTDKPTSARVPAAGTCIRPVDGHDSPMLDEAWVQYGSAIRLAKKKFRAAMDRQLNQARNRKQLEEAKRFKSAIESFETEGEFPIDCNELQAVAKTVRGEFKQAARKLEEKYEDVIGSILKDKNLPDPVGAADAVQKEWDGLENSIASRLPPKDALPIGKHSYFVYLDKVSQAEAADECRKRGGYLARITEEQESAAVGNLLLSSKTKIQLWVDGTDANKEGEWTTLDGIPLKRIPWATQQPDDFGNREDGLAVLVYPDKKVGWRCGMNDAPESERLGYICEWDDVP
jgi:hypothetical protein